MPRCPEEQTFQAFTEGALPEDAAAQFERHIDECDACRRLLAAIVPVHAGADARPAEEPSAILPEGARVGRYRIVEPLGHGGMGIVYAARDDELDRAIALKLVFTARSSSGSGQRSRIQREARAIAKLSHPNVVAIHDVGAYEGGLFIAMELVEGGTIRQVVADRRPSWREIVALYRDAGRGLAAAHAAGLVHRDFKPDNVLVGRDGRVRVADFGLARAAGEPAPPSASPPSIHEGAALAQTMTKSGTVLGTPAYMAPEQMRGEVADARADVFSFCVALYESLYGERPFDDATPRGLEKRRVKDPPAASEVPAWLRAAVLRGLEARPADRYASMEELLAALEEPRASPETPRAPRRWWPLALAGAVGIAAFGASIFAARIGPRAQDPPPAAPSAASAGIALDARRMRRITFAEGCEEFPAFSPDAKTIYFDGSTKGGSSIFALDVASGALRPLTLGDATNDAAPAPSPDGARVAFKRQQGGEQATFVVDARGGAPRKIAPGFVHPRWTPDGKHLWAGEDNRPARYDVESGEKLEEIAAPRGALTDAVVELPDGRLVMEFPALGNMTVTGVALVGVDRGPWTWLARESVDEAFDVSLARSVAFVNRTPVHGQTELVALPLDGSPPTPLLAGGLAPRKGLGVSRDGNSLVWSTCHAVVAMAKVEGEGFAKIGPDAEWDDFDAARLPGTDQVVVVSSRSGPEQLWVIDLAGVAPPRMIPTGDVHPAMLAVSPAGDLVAFTAQEGGIYVAPVRGDAPARKICPASDVQPSFARDGRRIMFTRRFPDGSPRVMIAPLDAGADAAEPLLPPWSVDAAWSPVDDLVVYTAVQGSKVKVLPTLFDPRTRTSRPLSRELRVGLYTRPRFSPDGKRVAMMYGVSALVEVDVATGAVTRRIDAAGDTLVAVTYAEQGLLVVRGQWTGDLWMAEGALGAVAAPDARR